MSATAVAVCQSTSLMAIACHKIVTVWMLYQHTITLKKTAVQKEDNTSATLPSNLAGSSLHARMSQRGQLSYMGKSYRSPNEKKADTEEKVSITLESYIRSLISDIFFLIFSICELLKWRIR